VAYYGDPYIMAGMEVVLTNILFNPKISCRSEDITNLGVMSEIGA
jgi:hypothetical protein